MWPGALLPAFALATALASATAAAGPLNDLPGRWTGEGSLVFSNGSTERLQCVATYFVDGNGSAVRHNLRCSNQGYKVDVAAKLAVANDRVSGEWEERTWAKTGTVAGTMGADGFNLKVTGLDFTATMAVTTSGCKQSISIMPTGFDISRIALTMVKC